MRRPRPLQAAELLGPVRKLLGSLPGVDETASWGHPNWRVGKKTFAVLERYKGRPCLAVKLGLERQQILVATDERFFVTPYVGKQGWVSLSFERPVSWAQVKALVMEAYRLGAAAAAPVKRRAAAKPIKRSSAAR